MEYRDLLLESGYNPEIIATWSDDECESEWDALRTNEPTKC
ncbi:hypothetical protein [Gorillibacterium sp. sgz5001074]